MQNTENRESTLVQTTNWPASWSSQPISWAMTGPETAAGIALTAIRVGTSTEVKPSGIRRVRAAPMTRAGRAQTLEDSQRQLRRQS